MLESIFCFVSCNHFLLFGLLYSTARKVSSEGLWQRSHAHTSVFAGATFISYIVQFTDVYLQLRFPEERRGGGYQKRVDWKISDSFAEGLPNSQWIFYQTGLQNCSSAAQDHVPCRKSGVANAASLNFKQTLKFID